MTVYRCSLLPLGRVSGDDALNVWEHIAFSHWMETHSIPGEDIRERRADKAFEEEEAYWESLVFRCPLEDALCLDDSSEFNEDDSYLYD